MEAVWLIVQVFLIVVASIALVALVGERATEVLKTLLILLGKVLPKIPQLALLVSQPVFKWLLALFVAWGITQGFSLDVLLQIDFLKDLDPELINVLSIVILWISENWLHDNLKLAGARTLLE